MKFTPTRNHILVKVDYKKEEVTESGIVVSSAVPEDEKVFFGTVVKQNSEPLIKEGAEVIFSVNSGKDITLDGDLFKIVKEKSVFLYTEQ